MKRVILPILALAFIATASSCAKCVTCKKGDEFLKSCDKDDSKDDVSNTIEYWENLGWECKQSSQMY